MTDETRDSAASLGSGLLPVGNDNVWPGIPVNTPLGAAVLRERKEGHDDVADALLTVDHVMREFAFTKEPLDEVAKEYAAILRGVAYDWIDCRLRPEEAELLRGYLLECDRGATQTGNISAQHVAWCKHEGAILRKLLERLT